MINEKKQTLETISTLPDNMRKLYAKHLMEMIKESEEDIENGRVMTLEEFKKFIDGLEEQYI